MFIILQSFGYGNEMLTLLMKEEIKHKPWELAAQTGEGCEVKPAVANECPIPDAGTIISL